MNNERAAAMLAGLVPGALVTIRLPDGRTATGRAHGAPGAWLARIAPGAMPAAVTAANLVRVQP